MRILPLICFVFIFSDCLGQSENADWSREKTEEEEAYTLTTQAYIYYTAPHMLYAILYQGQRVPYLDHKDGMPFNTWTRVPVLGNAQNASRVVMPNCNTLYASAWLDLRKEPVVLDIPPAGDRYFSIALMDSYSNNFQILGSRTVGPFGGRYLICSPDFQGIVPGGMTKIVAATPLIWAIQRIAPKFANDAETAQCRKIQEGTTITPLSQFGNTGYKEMAYNSKLDLGIPGDEKDPFSFFRISNQFIQLNPPPAADLGLLATFSKLGLGPGYTFNADKLSPAQKKGMLRGIETGRQIIDAFLKKSGELYNGWLLPPTDAGMYGTNYLLRAAYAVERVGVLLPSEAMYLTSYTDINGNEYAGSNSYVLHFEKPELPQVDAFWSLILYEVPSLLFYDNPINRYQMGPQVEEMKYNKDGSLDIYIQNEKPKDPKLAGNWLPAPNGKFMLTMRLYNARPAMFQIGPGKTSMPGVKPVK
jgi:hypothetical protein